MNCKLQRLVRQGKAWVTKHNVPFVGELAPRATKPVWEVGVLLPDGKRKRTCGATQKEARQKMKEYLSNETLCNAQAESEG